MTNSNFSMLQTEEAAPVPRDSRSAVVDLSEFRLRKLVIRYNLYPHLDIHASWWPRHWPTQYRRAGSFGEAAQPVLAEAWRDGSMGFALPTGFDGDFDSSIKRLMLLDLQSFRLLAVMCGLAVHRNVFHRWGWAPLARRQANRFGAGLADFIEERVPGLPDIGVNLQRLEERPQQLGVLMAGRGHRLLLGLLAPMGTVVVQRAQLKMPRHWAEQAVPQLSRVQRQQLQELILFCLIPERLPQWDWLF